DQEQATKVGKIFDHFKNGCKLISYPNDSKPLVAFMKNTNFVNINNMDTVTKNKGRYFAVYGSEDKMFSQENRDIIKAAVDPSRFTLLTGGHTLYSDQKEEFLRIFQNYFKAQ